MSLRQIILAALAASMFVASPALAQKKKKKDKGDNVTCTDRKGASRMFKLGRLAYRRGDNAEAVLRWQESYDLCAEPLIHLNIANAMERLGDKHLKAALGHLKKWRTSAPKDEHAELDQRIKTMEARVNEIIAAEKAAAAEEERRRKEEEERKRQAALAQQEEDGEFGTLPIVGWSMVGVGGAAIIAGVVMDVVASTSRPEESEVCTDTTGALLCRDSNRKDIERSNTLAIAGDITWIAGAVIAAGGATVLILEATGILTLDGGDEAGDASGEDAEGDEVEARVIPYATGDGAGVVISGSF